MAFLPEFIVILSAFIIILLDLFLTEKSRVILAPIAIISLIVTIVYVYMLGTGPWDFFGNRYGIDATAYWFKILFAVSGIVTILISLDTLDGRTQVKAKGIGFRGEFYAIMLLTISGMMLISSAKEIVTLYIALELATLPLFIFVAWKRDNIASGEAGLKYVILGGFSSALLLYGLGILWGLTGTTELDGMAAALRGNRSPAFWLGVSLLTSGVGFKLAMVPFHMWAADVYEGAPVMVTAYLSVASKAAGLAFMFQLFIRVLGVNLGDISPLIALFAAITMTLGNTVAIVQNNIKRFMAFSSISQAGYILMGFLGGDAGGVPAMLFYMLVYIATNIAVFGVIVFVSNASGKEMIDDYAGLSRTNPLMALGMMLGLFSLGGIPPLSGFVGKFFLFSIASKAGYHWLVALAAVNSTISLYYYLRIVTKMYISDPVLDAPQMKSGFALSATVGFTAVATSLLGIIPQVYEWIHRDTIHWLTLMIR